MTPQERVYMQGFAEKCAELGVDPEQLTKQAAMPGGINLSRIISMLSKGAKGVGKGVGGMLLSLPPAVPVAAAGAGAGFLAGRASAPKPKTLLEKIKERLGMG